MNWQEYLIRLRQQVPEAYLREYGRVEEGGQTYPLVVIDYPRPRTIVVTAGFHGEEPGGPLSLLHKLPEILDHARARDVGLRVYPCLNPSGFETGKRYNLSGETPNNSVMEYELFPGTWVGELPPSLNDTAAMFDTRVLARLPAKETRLLYEDLMVNRPLRPDMLGLLDLHQDDEIPPGTYAYVFGGRLPYQILMHQAAEIVPLWAEKTVDGHNSAHPVMTDRHGLCEYHDGTLSAWAWTKGAVAFTATLETASKMEAEWAWVVNAIWIKGFIDLVGRARGV